MDYHDIIAIESCEVKLNARTKDDAVRALVRLAVRSPMLAEIPPDTVYDALTKREAQGSTGFGNEIALPHARVPGLSRFVVFVAVCPRGVNFEAMDKKKVRLFFVILAPPEEVTGHLRILAGISRAIGHTHLKREILGAKSPEAIGETMLRHLGESSVTGGQLKEAMKLVLVNLYVEEHLHEILETMIELGIEGATILESTGMGRYVSSVPIFAEFIGFMKENKNFSKTILAMVPERLVAKVVDAIEEITGDLDTHDGAVVLVMDVARYKGSMRMM